MQVVNLDELDLLDSWIEADPRSRWGVSFPFFSGTGTQSLAIVYFEIEPGDSLARHTDSAEEVVFVVQGTVEARLGDRCSQMGAGGMAHIPAMVPHSVRNVGSEIARCIGLFGSPKVVTTFDAPVMPMSLSVLDTAQIPKTGPVAAQP